MTGRGSLVIRLDEAKSLEGATLLDVDGQDVGRIENVFLDQETHEPEWVLVAAHRYGSAHLLTGPSEVFVPLIDAQADPGDRILQVPYDKETISNAPVLPIDRDISMEHEQMLYEYYRLPYSDAASSTGLSEAPDEGRPVRVVRSGRAYIDEKKPRPMKLGDNVEVVGPGPTATGGGPNTDFEVATASDAPNGADQGSGGPRARGIRHLQEDEIAPEATTS